MEEMWLGRDKINTLWLFIGESPKKEGIEWINIPNNWVEIDSRLFPEVQWSDNKPTKVKLVIEKC